MIDIGFFYVDQGRPWWATAIDNLVASARETQPGCGVIHMGDKHTKQWPGTDRGILSDERIDATVLMVAKAFMWAQAAERAERPTVLVDADTVFHRDMAPLFEGDWDVGLLWRDEGLVALSQPYLACMALTKPTPGARAFWKRYAACTANLPRAWHGWWVDQVALGLLLGTVHNHGGLIVTPEFTVKLFEADALAPPVEVPGAYTVHYKGQRAEKKAA